MLMKQSQGSPIAFEAPADGPDLRHYLQIIKRRMAYFVVPAALVLLAGSAYVMWKKPIYLAEGKILVESQQIPTDLVRPTVTSSASERIQTIEQRIMARDNLLGIVEKFHMFPEERSRLSATQLLDLMRLRTHFSILTLNKARYGDALAITLTIGFEYENPEVAMQVVNELITLILAADARNRASRAQETTSFLAQEVSRLETSLGAVETQIADYKRKNVVGVDRQKTSLQIALTMAELQEKTAVFSSNHPDVIRLSRQLSALEKLATDTAQVESGLDALVNQRIAIQRNLEGTSEKLAAARLGENLERGQYSERLDVLEHAIAPQTPFKPDRRKLLALVFGLSIAAGAGCVVLGEMLDTTIKQKRDVYAIFAPSLVQAIPYIVTKQEVRRRKQWLLLGCGSAVAGFAAALFLVHNYVRPLDQFWDAILTRLMS